MREEPDPEFLRDPKLILKSGDDEIEAGDFIYLVRTCISTNPLLRPQNMNEIFVHLTCLCQQMERRRRSNSVVHYGFYYPNFKSNWGSKPRGRSELSARKTGEEDTIVVTPTPEGGDMREGDVGRKGRRLYVEIR